MINYLEQLIRSLDDDERSRIRTIELAPSERAYLDETLVRLSTSARTSAKTTEWTASHAYKMRSVLTNRILMTLAGDAELEQLSFLRLKRIRSLFDRKLRIAEEKLSDGICGEAREKLFRRLYQLALPWDVDADADAERLIREYTMKYAKARVVPLPHEELFVEAQVLLRLLLISSSTPKEQAVVLEKLEVLYTQLGQSTHIEARVTVLRALFEGYLRRHHCLDRASELNTELYELVRATPHLHNPRHAWVLLLERSRLLVLRGRNEEGYQLMKQLFSESPHGFMGHGFLEYVYFETCLYTDRIPEARTLIEEAQQKRGLLRVLHASDLALGTVLYHLFANDLPKALQLINECFRKDREHPFSFYDHMLLRAFEVACYVGLGEEQYAEQLIRRHLKFCEYNASKIPMTIVPRYLRLTQAILAEKQGVRKLQRNHLRKLEEIRDNPQTEDGYAFYLLLQRMRGRAD